MRLDYTPGEVGYHGSYLMKDTDLPHYSPQNRISTTLEGLRNNTIRSHSARNRLPQDDD